MVDFDPVIALVLFVVAVMAGFVDSIAGGGGLLTVPALLWAGLSPAQTLATNKLQSCFGSGSASLNFIRAGKVSLRHCWQAILCSGLGSIAGSLAVHWLSPDLLKTIIPFLLMTAALFFLFAPNLTGPARPPKLSPLLYALLVGSSLGFYDGFFGPGTGSFLVLSLVTLVGLDLSTATARTKLLNFASNIASFAVFVWGGQMIWSLGLIMAVGQGIGAKAGSQIVLDKGPTIIKPFLVVISLGLTIKILLQR